ncbi:MAG: heparinase II/III family protein, partial [Candidatus Glassbacteria bacterium]|nr:heparinase II/III family protein [Candidatus Glassbacteria bacterium]
FERRSRLRDLVLAECVEGRGRFLDEILNGVWAICEESSWAISAHVGHQKAGVGLPDTEDPQVALFSCETASLLAWTVYLVGGRLDEGSPLITSRLDREIKRRVLDPAIERDDWPWMGFEGGWVNNWNPWCNSNLLSPLLLLERQEARRAAGVHKILRSLDVFLGSYQADGGCDEGPGYWNVAGGALFDCLEVLRSATGGALDVYDQPLVQEIGRYIYRVHIHDRYYINFADASAKVGIADDLVFRYGKRIGDKNLMALGAWAARGRMAAGPGASGSIGRQLPALAGLEELQAAPAAQPLVRDVWLQGIHVMAARSAGGAAEGLYLAAKGGHNAESHNHNDVGNFIVYVDGRPAIIDAGVGTYTAKTFSPQRYEIWTMQSAYHNLPTVNGVMQQEGREFAARDVRYRSGSSFAELSLDIAGAYPPRAGVESWKRKIRLDRAGEVRVEDDYKLTRSDGGLTLSLLTPCRVALEGPGRIVLTEKAEAVEAFSLRVYYPAGKLTAAVESITLDDARLESVWGGELNRILLSAPAGAPLRDKWTLKVVK